MLLLAHLLAVAPHVAARCIDIGEHCQDWKYHGECKKNEGYMSAHCRKSCGFCDPVLVSMDKLMTDVDTNSDLFISLDELSARLLKIRLAEEKIGQLEAASARNEIARLQNPHDPDGAFELEDFKRQDMDGDWKLNVTEMHAQIAPLFQEVTDANNKRRAGDGQRGGDPADGAGARHEQRDQLKHAEELMELESAIELESLRLRLADADRDGSLNFKEFVVSRHSRFDNSTEYQALIGKHQKEQTLHQAKRVMYDMDTNGDQVLDTIEIETGHDLIVGATHPDHVHDEL